MTPPQTATTAVAPPAVSRQRLPLMEDPSKALTFSIVTISIALPGSERKTHALSGWFEIYVPSRYGGVLEVGCSEPAADVSLIRRGATTPLKDLAGNPLQPADRVAYPVRPGEFGWFDVSVGKLPQSGTYRMWATFREIGLAREDNTDDAEPLIPWNFWYFPYGGARREQTAWGSATLQPLQKYEQAFGKAGVLAWEKANHNDPAGTRQGWEGHCHHASHASVLFKPPPPQGVAFNGVQFSCEELKLLATEFAGNTRNWKHVWQLPGIPGVIDLLRGEKPGQAKSAASKKMFGNEAARFHKVIQEYLIQDRKALVMDLGQESGVSPYELWNQAVYRYESRFWETPSSGDWKDIQVEATLYANQDLIPANFASSGLPASIVAQGPLPGGKPHTVTSNTTTPGRDEVLRYRLIFKDDGQINDDPNEVKNEWYSVKDPTGKIDLWAPRYIAEPGKPSTTVASDGNVKVDSADVLRLLELRDRFK